ncbi:MAG TPA: hypothetical protein VIL52_00180, partial [Bacteroidota bacterium]
MTPVVLQHDASARSFVVLNLRGFDEPDEIRLVGVQHGYRNGIVEEQLRGFKRVMTVDFGVLATQLDRLFVLNFLKSANRQIRTASQLAHVALEDPERFTNAWVEDIQHGSRFILRLIDQGVYRVFPTIATETDIM